MKKTRFGIVGTGRISDWVLKGAVLEPRFEAAAVCSRSLEKGRAFAEAHGIAKVYTDLDEMASDPEIDAIYIGTPNSTHHDLAILCMNHGKHVLCEKPMASNAREVGEMIDAAKANGVMLMEAMISTLCPNFVAARERLAEMGSVRHYFASFCQYSSKYDLVKRIIAGDDNSAVPSSFNPDCCGGALMDIGIYPIYPMVALFGRPKGVKADITTCEVPVESGRFGTSTGSVTGAGTSTSSVTVAGTSAGSVTEAGTSTSSVTGAGTSAGSVTETGTSASSAAEADAEPVEASGRKGWKRVDLQGSVIFEYEGMSATVLYSKIADSHLCTEISCDRGILSLDQIHICRHAEMTRRGAPTSGRSSGPSAVDISVPADADEYLCEFREFIDVLESGCLESSVNSLETSLVTAEILDEIRHQAGVVFPDD